MKNILILSVVICFSLFAQQKEVKTLDNVDLKKYIGLWYEVAKIPNWFQSDCIKNTTAEYYFNDDGSINVRNSCIEEDGEVDIANGLARVVDKTTKSKLEVSFVNLLGIRLFWGDYWIIGLGKNYDYAVVVTPSRKYAWILSRTKKMDKEKLDEVFALLKEQGFEKSRFVFTTQD